MNNKKTLSLTIAFALLFLFVSAANAQMTFTVTLTNQSGNTIMANTAVPVGTIVNLTGRYINSNHYNALVMMTVYFSPNNTTYTLKKTLFMGVIGCNKTINAGPYALTAIGYYEFRWACVQIGAGPTNSRNRASNGQTCSVGSASVRTYINNVVPEPAPIIGALMGIAALGIFFFKKNSRFIKNH